jgi:PHD/YefM family antitoxin component YafN of YafNO toxin-antitoxin module
MQHLLADRAISMSEFKKNPAAVLRAAKGRPVAVLNHNRVGFYLLEPALLDALLEELRRLLVANPSAPASQHQLIEALLIKLQTTRS